MDNNDYLENRAKQLGQPYICPFCGKKDCNNIWHLIKLTTVSRSYVKPKQFFYVYGLLALIILVVTIVYLSTKSLM